MKPPDENWWKEERVKCIGCSTETYASDYEDVRGKNWSPLVSSVPTWIMVTEMNLRVSCKQLQCPNCEAINWLIPPSKRRDLHVDASKLLDDALAAMPRGKISSLLKKQKP